MSVQPRAASHPVGKSRGKNGGGSQRSSSSDDEGQGRAVGFPGVSGVGGWERPMWVGISFLDLYVGAD